MMPTRAATDAVKVLEDFIRAVVRDEKHDSVEYHTDVMDARLPLAARLADLSALNPET